MKFQEGAGHELFLPQWFKGFLKGALRDERVIAVQYLNVMALQYLNKGTAQSKTTKHVQSSDIPRLTHVSTYNRLQESI